MGLGVVLALAVALPLFIWGVITQRFDIREKAEEERFTVLIDNEPIKGPIDAPVIIAEFGDLQCPFCKNFAEVTLPQIISTYGSYVGFVFKDFPLTAIHPLAEKAAIAANCAFSQSKFWEMHDLIYTNQDTLTEANFAAFAAQIGLDQATFDTCYQNQTPLSEIQGDVSEGQTLNVTGTPTFFINGLMVNGALPFDNFKTIINSELLLKDDLRFDPPHLVISFTTTDQNPNVSISPDKLEDGKTYVLNVTYQLQNTIKVQDLTTSNIKVTLFINNNEVSSKEISYSLVSGHTDGAGDSQSASFSATGNTTNIHLLIDQANAFVETNENNNTATYSFSSSIGGVQETPSPTPTPGEPNYCGGTCGSNYNCQGNYFCFEGYCRNPLCKEDSDCDCVTPTSKPTTKPKTTIKPSPTTEIIYISPSGSSSSSPRPSLTARPSATPTSTPSPKESSRLGFLLYIAAGSLGTALLLIIANTLRKK